MNTYDKGDVPKISASFTDNGAVYDPDIVQFRVMDPEGDEVTYVYGVDAEVIRDSAGHYHMDLAAIDLSGVWVYHAEGFTTDNPALAQGSGENRFYIRR